jgi:hypothetical protein
MFRDLKDFTKKVHREDTQMYVVVEEMIDAPFFQALLDKRNNIYKLYKSNGEELSVTDIILNSMYSDIDKFVKTVFESLSDKEYESCSFGAFYFPIEIPRSTKYIKYVGKYMLSYVHGDFDEDDIIKTSENWLKITPKIIEYTLTKNDYSTIKDYENGESSPVQVATILTRAYKRIDHNRTKVSDMEGIVLKTKEGNYKLTINQAHEILDVSERKMCRDLILKDFVRWFTTNEIHPINDTYQNIVSDLFLLYVNATDISTRYSFEEKYLNPPIVGYVGDITYEWLENRAVIEICKHDGIMKGIFKILLNSLRKPLKKHLDDILTDNDINNFNKIVERIKAEVI